MIIVLEATTREYQNPDGGYETSVANKFTEIFQKRYSSYFDSKVVNYLFPSYIFNIKEDPEEDLERVAELFEKYNA